MGAGITVGEQHRPRPGESQTHRQVVTPGAPPADVSSRIAMPINDPRHARPRPRSCEASMAIVGACLALTSTLTRVDVPSGPRVPGQPPRRRRSPTSLSLGLRIDRRGKRNRAEPANREGACSSAPDRPSSLSPTTARPSGGKGDVGDRGRRDEHLPAGRRRRASRPDSAAHRPARLRHRASAQRDRGEVAGFDRLPAIDGLRRSPPPRSPWRPGNRSRTTAGRPGRSR